MITLLLIIITLFLGGILFILYKYGVLIVEEAKQEAREKKLKIQWENDRKESREKAKEFNKIK